MLFICRDSTETLILKIKEIDEKFIKIQLKIFIDMKENKYLDLIEHQFYLNEYNF